MKKRLFILLIASMLGSIVFVQSPSKAYACDCYVPDTAVEALASSAAVFSGEAAAIRKVRRSGEAYNAVLMLVDTTWKGIDHSQVIVYTSWSSCQFEFEIGKSYLLYAYVNNGELHVMDCGRSGELQRVLADVNELGQGKPPSQIVNLSSEFSFLKNMGYIAATAAVILLALAGIAIAVRRVRVSPRK